MFDGFVSNRIAAFEKGAAEVFVRTNTFFWIHSGGSGA